MPRLKSTRPPYQPRAFLLAHEDALQRAIAAIRQSPVDSLRPLQVLIREEPKKRKLDQQALMWAGPLRSMAAHAWIEGRQYSAETWHEYFKREFLPEEFDPELCLDGYQKWDVDPGGQRVLVGSTTQLTVKGMAQHIEQIHAFGASLGMRFSVNPNDQQ